MAHREILTPIPAIVGPTASGKTALSLSLGARLSAEIVSSDSMQIYRGMDIGTAKPTAEERAALPHHMLDVVEPTEPYSAAAYARAARAAIGEILARGKTPLLCGGTGLYLSALRRGGEEDPIPGETAVRAALEKEGAEIEKACAGCYTVAACIEGRKVTSEGLSELLEKVSLSGKGKMAFVIGSSHGLSESVKRKADFRLSVSDMTFPHQLFRVMLLEQIYRAFTISAGAKYHK